MDIKTLTGNNLRPDGTATGVKPRGLPNPQEPTAVKTGAVSGESVTLTETAKTLSAARGSAQDVPFDDARVADIKAAISEGRYPIDTRRLADSLLRFEGMLS